MDVDASWGTVTRVLLSRDPQAVSQARSFALTSLAAWSLTTLSDRVALVVSELVTNAVRYGKDPVELSLHRRAKDLRVDVADGVPTTQAAHAGPSVGDFAESGRGLAIVRAVADSFDWVDVPDDGKIACATFTI